MKYRNAAIALLLLPCLTACVPLLLGNDEPDSPSIWLSGSPDVEGDAFEVFMTSTDPDGDAISYRLSASSGGQHVDSGWSMFVASYDTISFRLVLGSGNWTLTGSAKDEIGDESTSTINVDVDPVPAVWSSVEPGPGSSLAGLHFADPDTGWTWTWYANGIYRTTDGGAHWSTHQDVENAVSDPFFIDGMNGWRLTSTEVARTHDGGVTWEVICTGLSGNTRVWFTSLERGFLLTGNSGEPRLLRSTDGGATWSSPTVNASNTMLLDLYFVDQEHGWAAGYDGLCLRTVDGGDTWDPSFIDLGYTLSGLYFVNELVGYVGTGIWQRCYRTDDGGITWNRLYNTEVFYMDESGYGWGINDGGELSFTGSGGQTWVTVQSDILVHRIEMLSRDSGWGISREYTLLRAAPRTKSGPGPSSILLVGSD